MTVGKMDEMQDETYQMRAGRRERGPEMETNINF